MVQEIDNISMFDILQQDEPHQKVTSRKLDIVKMSFDEVESCTWQDLFRGYDRMYAITYSSGVDFACKLIKMFDYAEVIFGCESVMSSTLQEIMAYQGMLNEKIRKTKTNDLLLERLENGSLKFYVSRKQLSHEKLYLLENNEGKKRVIMGSANMSYSAFGGGQRENICYIDGNRAFDWYYTVFKELQNDSTDEITRSSLELSDFEDNIDELPIAHTVKVKKVLALEPVKTNEENVQFVLDTRNMADKLAPVIPKPEKKNGKILISPEFIRKIHRQVIQDREHEREMRNEFPQLVVDVFENRATLNDEVLDLHPQQGEIKRDVELFLRYMNGFSRFYGSWEDLQMRYFEFANWFFCSPFMGTMRDMATRYNQGRLPYPVFGLIYGQSKAGKTSFIETLLKMMIGQKPKLAANEFSRSSMEKLKRTVKGAPIIVDDLTNTRFNQHAIETIKNDDFGFNEHLIHYPAIVISANEDVKAVSPEIIRRTVICRVAAGLTNTDVMKSSVVKNVQQNIGTALYREYLRRMLDQMPDLIEQIRSENEDAETPDILKVSSQILFDLFSEHTDNVPAFIHPLSLENYFSEKVTGQNTIKTVQTAWKANKKAFSIDKKLNELKYDAGATYEAERFMKELPENLVPRKAGSWVIMDLTEAKDFFGIDFKMGFWSRLKN